MPEIQHGMVVDGHLGGYVPGGDPATFYPALWEWLIEGPEKVRSVLDVGAGDGAAVSWFLEHEVEAWGVDGIPQEHPNIFERDFTVETFSAPRDYDLVWSCEFVEHVDREFVPNFLEAFKLGRLLLITHAEPGQAGWHHVNCQHAGYWIAVMEGIGYVLDQKLTNRTRELARENPDPWNHYARSGLAFRRRGEEAVADHERLIQGESEMREEQEISSEDTAPMPAIEEAPASGSETQEEE